MNEEVVAETSEVAPEETANTESAQTDEKSLDDLLNEFGNEFDDGTKPPESTEKTSAKTEISATEIADIRTFMAEQDRKTTDNAVLEAAKKVKAAIGTDLPINISEQRLVDSLYGRAARDPKFTQAFLGRNTNPELFDKVLVQYAKEYLADLNPVDQQVTNDRDAVISSIRGQSTVKEEAPKMDGWSDRRFEHYSRTLKDDPSLQ